jgi:class 3 adenylate cyclase
MNLVSRFEALARMLNLSVMVSDDFARAYGEQLYPLGRPKLRRFRDAPPSVFSASTRF